MKHLCQWEHALSTLENLNVYVSVCVSVYVCALGFAKVSQLFRFCCIFYFDYCLSKVSKVLLERLSGRSVSVC